MDSSRLNQLINDGWLKAVSNSRVYISWDDNDVVSMLENAGDRKSSEEGGDSDALETDPVWDWSQRKGSLLDFEEIQEKDLEQSKVSYILALVLEVAARMKEDDICVIFGRDMYPAQAAMVAWKDFLPGTWIYWEGLSRELVDGESSETLQGVVLPMMTRKTKVFGVDTGFNGTIPFRALSRCHEAGELRVRLLSSSCNSLRVFSEEDGNGGGGISEVRQIAIDIEHYPKPFMRAVECFEGLPVLRLSGYKDIQKAVGYWLAVKAKATELLEDLPCLLFELQEGNLNADVCEQRLVDGFDLDSRRSQFTWSLGEEKGKWREKRSPFIMKQALKVPAKKKETKAHSTVEGEGCGNKKCFALSRMLKAYADEQNKRATEALSKVDINTLFEKGEVGLGLGVQSINRKFGWSQTVEAYAVGYHYNPIIQWRKAGPRSTIK